MREGFVLHDKSSSIKQQVMLRRLELKATAEVFLVRPSFPDALHGGSDGGRGKGSLSAPQGVPFDALVHVFGRDAMYWYRAERALGRPAIVGNTVKQPEKLPTRVLADGLTWALGQEVYVATTVGWLHPRRDRDRCGLGRRAGGRVRRVCPGGTRAVAHLQPQDGVHRRLGSTQSAWRRLFPAVCIILCFLHSVLKIAERCGRDRATRTLVLDRVWKVYDACTRAQFSQRHRRLREWATAGLPEGALRQMVLKLCDKGPQFARA